MTDYVQIGYSVNIFRKIHMGCKEKTVHTSGKATDIPAGRAPTHLSEAETSAGRLREIRTEAVKADVLEGFAEIDRGEVVEMTLEELSREVERCQLDRTRRA